MNNIDIFTSEDYENINLDYPEGYLEELVEALEQENKQLQDNWNELKNILNLKIIRLKNEPDYSKYYIQGISEAINQLNLTIGGTCIEFNKSALIKLSEEILDKMQELEKGDSNE